MIPIHSLCWSSIMALFNHDIKAIIAYSTISQLSFMFISINASMLLCLYHVIIHALFKSLLFIIAGSLIHCNSNNQSINRLHLQHLNQLPFYYSLFILIMASSKELIIINVINAFQSSLLIIALNIGFIVTLLYSVNLYAVINGFNENVHHSIIIGLISITLADYSLINIFSSIASYNSMSYSLMLFMLIIP